jgi:hypothetical protein
VSLTTVCSMRRGAGALVVAMLLTGCGQSTSVKRMNAQFDALDYKMATEYETAAAPYNNLLDKATQRYIALVREYADQLGPDEAKRRLMAKGDEVSAFCTACAQSLYDEAKKY